MDTADQSITLPEAEKSAHRDRIRTVTVFIFIVIALVIVGYSTLFTRSGNRLIKPLVKGQLESVLQQPITLQKFFLNLNRFELGFRDNAQNIVQAKASYSLFPPRIDGNYELNLTKPEGINPLGSPLQIHGTIKGAYHRLILTGKVEIFQGWADYNTTLLFTSPDCIKLELHRIHYQALMDFLEYPHNSDTLIDGNMTLDGLKKRDITANADLKATTNRFTPSILIEDDNETFDFWKLIADKNGKIAPFSMNAKIKAQMDELGILEQFVTYPLRTSASLEGTLHGTQHQLVIDAKTNAAKSDAHAVLTLRNLRPNKLHVTLKHADVPALFTLLSLPSPITGNLDAHADTDFSNATVTLNLQKAHTQPAILKREYGITQPNMVFDSFLKMAITPKERHYSGVFTSDLESLTIVNSPNHDQMLQELLRQLQQNRPKGKF